MRHSTVTIVLSREERQALRHLVRCWTQPALLRDRARMVLLRAEGLPISQISRYVGRTPGLIYRCLYAWQRAGMSGILGPLPRHGARGER